MSLASMRLMLCDKVSTSAFSPKLVNCGPNASILKLAFTRGSVATFARKRAFLLFVLGQIRFIWGGCFPLGLDHQFPRLSSIDSIREADAPVARSPVISLLPKCSRTKCVGVTPQGHHVGDAPARTMGVVAVKPRPQPWWFGIENYRVSGVRGALHRVLGCPSAVHRVHTDAPLALVKSVRRTNQAATSSVA